MEITKIIGREIPDSRGNPTVEVDAWLAEDSVDREVTLSGASTAEYEAVALRNPAHAAVSNVAQSVDPAWLRVSAERQLNIDHLKFYLDGTSDKARLGANAILAVPIANARMAQGDWELWKMVPDRLGKKFQPVDNVRFVREMDGTATRITIAFGAMRKTFE